MITLSLAWLMLIFFFKPKNVLHQVSTDLGEVNGFYSSFSDADQKVPSCLSKVQKSLPGIELKWDDNVDYI